MPMNEKIDKKLNKFVTKAINFVKSFWPTICVAFLLFWGLWKLYHFGSFFEESNLRETISLGSLFAAIAIPIVVFNLKNFQKISRVKIQEGNAYHALDKIILELINLYTSLPIFFGKVLDKKIIQESSQKLPFPELCIDGIFQIVKSQHLLNTEKEHFRDSLISLTPQIQKLEQNYKETKDIHNELASILIKPLSEIIENEVNKEGLFKKGILEPQPFEFLKIHEFQTQVRELRRNISETLLLLIESIVMTDFIIENSNTKIVKQYLERINLIDCEDVIRAKFLNFVIDVNYFIEEKRIAKYMKISEKSSFPKNNIPKSNNKDRGTDLTPSLN